MKQDLSFRQIYITYFISVFLFIIAYYFPGWRLWGFNQAAYLSERITYTIFTVGIIAPFLIPFILNRKLSSYFENNNRLYIIITVFTVIIYFSLFYFLKIKTYFLGDGYQTLSLLSTDSSPIKNFEFGESLLHIWVKSLFSGSSNQAALLSFQTISIVSGLIFVLTTALSSRLLFEKNFDRIIFLLGVGSGGYLLLFFGYVENYSIFITFTSIYTLIGLLIIKNKINKWFCLPAALLTAFMHIMGVTLLPSMIFLLLRDSSLVKRFSINKNLQLASFSILVIITFTIFIYFYQTNYFFQFSIIPVFATQFTVEGYTLLSLNHLIDIINLIILLLPSVFLSLLILFKLKSHNIHKEQAVKYLLILVVSTLGAVFIFDPKLGMPRDWDLFSFAGLPLAIMSFYIIVEYKSRINFYKEAVVLLILLNFMVLIPRVLSQFYPDVSIKHLENYMKLDRIKNQNAYVPLINYYEEIGDTLTADLMRQEWDALFPEQITNLLALDYYENGNVTKAVELFNETISKNPLCFGYYNNLAMCMMYINNNDSAYKLIQISNGLNPHSHITYFYYGFYYFLEKDFTNAESYWNKSLKIDSSYFASLYGLMQMYREWDKIEKLRKYFIKVCNHKDASVNDIVNLSAYYFQEEDSLKGKEALQRALEKGLDSSTYHELLNQYRK